MTGWTDADGAAVDAPRPPTGGSYYRDIGDWQGESYERNAFTRGTEQEAGYLREVLGLSEGDRLLDVGCGTGRHTRRLADDGVAGTGVDVSFGLLQAAARRLPGRWVHADARRLPFGDGAFDAAMSVCQGGFGLTLGGDTAVMAEMARVVRSGGRVALTAFSLVFASRWLAPGDAFDAGAGLLHSTADVRGPDGRSRSFDLWTQCYSAGHLRLACASAGLELESLSGVEPGGYGDAPPTLLHPEILVVASKP